MIVLLIATCMAGIIWNNHHIQIRDVNSPYKIDKALMQKQDFKNKIVNQPETYKNTMLYTYLDDCGDLPFEQIVFAFCSSKGYPKKTQTDVIIYIDSKDRNKTQQIQNEIDYALDFAKNTYKAKKVSFVTALHLQKEAEVINVAKKSQLYVGHIDRLLKTLDVYKNLTEKHNIDLEKVISSKDPDNDFCQMATNKLVLPTDGNGIEHVLNLMRFHFRPRKVIAYVLYGIQNKRYSRNMKTNIDLAKHFYPGWELRLYTDKPKPLWEKTGYNVVVVKNALRAAGGDLRRLRILVAADPFVDVYILRDIDSLLSQREASAVNEWLNSEKLYHAMHDHPAHKGCKIMAGMWGGRKPLKNIKQSLTKIIPGDDQSFLAQVVWPIIKSSILVHNSFGTLTHVKSQKFPTKRKQSEFIGAVMPSRSFDVRPLQKALQLQND